MHQVIVTSGAWYWRGYNAFGLSLLPLLLGMGLLFFNGRSLPGWFLTGAGTVIIFVGILAHLEIYFRPTSLFTCWCSWSVVSAWSPVRSGRRERALSRQTA